MSARITFECDGCDYKCEPRSVRFEWRSVSGRAGGFGRFTQVESVTDLAPDGWKVPDPYTGACYCPGCWQEITKDTASVAAEQKP